MYIDVVEYLVEEKTIFSIADPTILGFICQEQTLNPSQNISDPGFQGPIFASIRKLDVTRCLSLDAC
jgi:hypothetical protein